MNKTYQSDKPEILIVGASTRAAAHSAVRAGFRPVCVDQYGDQDLSEIAVVLPKTENDSDWLQVLSQRPSLDWIYTGALENQPDRIDQISQKHRLNGCHSGILKYARDPFFLEQILSQKSIQVPTCLTSGSLPREDTSQNDMKWLRKPFRSSAGLGIHFVDPACPEFKINESCYLQQFQPGIPLSVLFLAFREMSILVGISRQFIGEPALNAEPFQFCGGMTFKSVPSLWRRPLEILGQTIADKCQIQGIFGCDIILDSEHANRIWLNEVNPRYTALTELFEFQYRLPLLAWHFEACRTFEGHSPEKQAAQKLQNLLIQAEKQSFTRVAKGILYADQEVLCPEIDWKRNTTSDLYQIPEIADIPRQGTLIQSGSPICSLFGTGSNHLDCLRSLSKRIVETRQLYQPALCTTKSNWNVSNMVGASMELEKSLFSSFFSSQNELHSFLED